MASYSTPLPFDSGVYYIAGGDKLIANHMAGVDITSVDFIDDTHCDVVLDTGFMMHCVLLNGDKWVPSSDTCPSIVTDNVVYFFYDGMNYKLEDMPVDDACRLMLVLKYGGLEEIDNLGYVGYRHAS